jgi:hypothetical protein
VLTTPNKGTYVMSKEKILEVVKSFPEDVDLDALLNKLYVMQKIEIGEQQIDRGEGVPHDEVVKRFGL